MQATSDARTSGARSWIVSAWSRTRWSARTRCRSCARSPLPPTLSPEARQEPPPPTPGWSSGSLPQFAPQPREQSVATRLVRCLQRRATSASRTWPTTRTPFTSCSSSSTCCSTSWPPSCSTWHGWNPARMPRRGLPRSSCSMRFRRRTPWQATLLRCGRCSTPAARACSGERRTCSATSGTTADGLRRSTAAASRSELTWQRPPARWSTAAISSN